MGNATMGRITHDGSCGSFPVVGARRGRGASEIVRGRVTWHSSGQFECAEGRRMVLAGMIPDGDRKWAFARSAIELEREFIGRLGKYDRDAHRQLVSMLDWDETRGADVQVADDPAVHATFGFFSFEGVRYDREAVEDARGSISWMAQPEKAPTAMRCIHAAMSLEGDDEVHGDGYFDGEFDAGCGFIGSLAECGEEARVALIGRMGWNADGGKFDVRPC